MESKAVKFQMRRLLADALPPIAAQAFKLVRADRDVVLEVGHFDLFEVVEGQKAEEQRAPGADLPVLNVFITHRFHLADTGLRALVQAGKAAEKYLVEFGASVEPQEEP